MYSPDLVRTCASWAQRASPGARVNDLAASSEWERICPSTTSLPPRYAENYKKRMDLTSAFHPDTGTGPAGFVSTTSSTSSHASSSAFYGDEPRDHFSLGHSLLSGREDRFTSLADLKWGEFETLGFTGLETTEKKLQFDLTEGARTVRWFILTKRVTFLKNFPHRLEPQNVRL